MTIYEIILILKNEPQKNRHFVFPLTSTEAHYFPSIVNDFICMLLLCKEISKKYTPFKGNVSLLMRESNA